MFQLKTNAKYTLVIILKNSYCSNFLFIQSFNTCSLTLHFENILVDPNLLTYYIFLFKCKNNNKNSFQFRNLQ
jgi:hypothetical protein